MTSPKIYRVPEENIRVTPEASKGDLQKASTWAQHTIPKDAETLVYMSGHGYPVGDNGFKMDGGIRGKDIDSLMSSIPSDNKVLVLEACHAGRMVNP